MSRKSILIVDDDFGIRSNLRKLFEGEGYSVVLTIHGQAALDFLTGSPTSPPGVILLDLMMPVMDGPTFLQELRRLQPEMFAHIPVFLVSAGLNTHRITPYATGYLNKPFNLDELSRIAARYCSG